MDDRNCPTWRSRDCTLAKFELPLFGQRLKLCNNTVSVVSPYVLPTSRLPSALVKAIIRCSYSPVSSNQDLLVCPTGRPTRFGYAATILLARIPRILAKASLHKLVGLSLVHDRIMMPTCLVTHVTLSTPGTRMV